MRSRKKRRAVKAAARQERAAMLYCQGLTQRQIARELEVSLGTVCQDLRSAQEHWLSATTRNIDALRAEQLAKLDELERRANVAWAESCKVAVKTAERVRSAPTPAAGSPAPEITVTTTREPRVGDPRFLDVIRQCIERRCKLLSVDRPVKIEASLNDALTPEERAENTARIIALLKERAAAGGGIGPEAGTSQHGVDRDGRSVQGDGQSEIE